MRWTSLLAMGAAMMGALAGPAFANAQSDGALAPKVLEGKIASSYEAQPGTNVRWGRAEALVDAKYEDVLRVIENYGGYKGFMPNFQSSKVLSQRGASALVYVQVSVMGGASKIWAELKLKPKKGTGTTRVIEGKMLKGNVKHFGARWEITPHESGKTLVAFSLLVDPDLPMPSKMISAENQKSARKTIRALREQLAARK